MSPVGLSLPDFPWDTLVPAKATAAAQKLLASALGVAPTRLTLTRGAAARDKRFRLD